MQSSKEKQEEIKKSSSVNTVKEKKIEKNSRVGKTRDLIKKTGDTRGNFHARMGTLKDRNGKD